METNVERFDVSGIDEDIKFCQYAPLVNGHWLSNN